LKEEKNNDLNFINIRLHLLGWSFLMLSEKNNYLNFVNYIITYLVENNSNNII